MDTETRESHLAVSRAAGQQVACGRRIDYPSKAAAQKSASIMNERGSSDMEPQPCAWCSGWHIGRKDLLMLSGITP